MVKKVHAEGEQSKVAVRSIRRDAIEDIKKLQKNGLSEEDSVICRKKNGTRDGKNIRQK